MKTYTIYNTEKKGAWVSAEVTTLDLHPSRRAVVNRRVYDCDKARFYFGEAEGFFADRFETNYKGAHAQSWTIYRKANGEYFLRGVGGSLTFWGFSENGRGTRRGEKFIPIPQQVAEVIRAARIDNGRSCPKLPVYFMRGVGDTVRTRIYTEFGKPELHVIVGANVKRFEQAC